MEKKCNFFSKHMKRIFDIVITLLVFPFFIPLFVAIYLMVRCNLGKPVFFIQERPGLNEKPFKMFKFRTMLDKYDICSGELLPDDQRLTKLGRWLRSTSLDELPELYNVLKGEMSLVGPRPLLMEYLGLYNKRQAYRHKVKPGITGLAQISGRNELSWEERFEFDYYYVTNQSLWFDFKILLLTFKKVLHKEGISEKGKATMSKFTGNK
ncbi:sugar transferase [Zooshikella ganghwensis]|uniref:sugar transferase n=1 Tax=Zooshikella ganghwensis TaxID=202772 RepID=UPI001F2B3D39|nr:sugar transferase [Zooshikella ganghwensis]